MPIRFMPQTAQFLIHTIHTTYAFDVVDGRYLRHIYYGPRTETVEPPDGRTYSFAPYLPANGSAHSPDTLPCEFSCFGSGDFRSTSLRINSDGTGVTDFTYASYRIFPGRAPLGGLPEARPDRDTETLEIAMTDEVSGCRLFLFYTVYPETDIIGRYMRVENGGRSPVRIEACMPLELPLARSDLDMISLWGGHNRECNLQRVPLHHGVQSVFSRRRASSHHYNPFTCLVGHRTTEDRGEAYGFNLIWSGSFRCEVELDQTNTAKMLVGLDADSLGYTLDPGRSFTSPEAVMTYSASGLGRMSRQFHGFIRQHLLPSAALEPHPVVLNTWEACYFDIDEAKLIRFAEEAAAVGFDMLVMDDGWFGARNHDRAGLGDWVPNPQKFPRGLAAFADDIRARGVRFGIWIEPEMVNPDSDLYRSHPDWAIRVPGREPLQSRHQLVLDFSNDAVVDYLIDRFGKTFDGVAVDYFKWDMNRHLSGVASPALPADRQGDVPFRYMKGVYRLLAWFRAHFPHAVIETCSGGGGRYDLGMMPYGFQIWTSDNTDPYARTRIQSAALTGYPAATMSCHVSDPHGSLHSLDYRYKVAVGGMLGYELNILNMSDKIKAAIASQIKDYKAFEHILRLGDYYNLASPFRHDYSAYYYASADASELLLTVIEQANARPGKTKRLKLTRADEHAVYTDYFTGATYTGHDLRHGLTLPITGERDRAELLYLRKQ